MMIVFIYACSQKNDGAAYPDSLFRKKTKGGFWRTVASFFLLSALYVMSGCTRQSFEVRGSVESFTEYLDERITRLMQRYGIPGVSIALIRGGEPVWLGAYGHADVQSGRMMTVDAV